MTQKDLADQLIVSEQDIDSWENNQTKANIYILERISVLYEMPIDDLMEDDVSRSSIIKYKIKKYSMIITNFIKKYLFLFIISFLALTTLLMALILPALYSYYLLILMITITTLFLMFEYTKWHILLLMISLPELIRHTLLLFFPNIYFDQLAQNEPFIMVINIMIICLSVALIADSLLAFKHHKKRAIKQGIVLFAALVWIFLSSILSSIFIFSTILTSENYHSKITKINQPFGKVLLIILFFYSLVLFNEKIYQENNNQMITFSINN